MIIIQRKTELPNKEELLYNKVISLVGIDHHQWLDKIIHFMSKLKFLAFQVKNNTSLHLITSRILRLAAVVKSKNKMFLTN